MLVQAIKGKDLLKLLSIEGVEATLVQGTTLDIDPNGYSVIAETIDARSFLLLIKVLRDTNPRLAIIHVPEKPDDLIVNFWVELETRTAN